MVLATILASAAVVAAATWLFLRSRLARAGGPGEPLGPWWSSPAAMAVAGVLVLIGGAIVAPRLLGIGFFILPFIWSRIMARRFGEGRGPFDR